MPKRSVLSLQAHVLRYILDNLLVLLGGGDTATRGAISIKSGRELTAAGFSDEFVQDAWEEWQRPGFDVNADLLVLVGVAGDHISTTQGIGRIVAAGRLSARARRHCRRPGVERPPVLPE